MFSTSSIKYLPEAFHLLLFSHYVKAIKLHQNQNLTTKINDQFKPHKCIAPSRCEPFNLRTTNAFKCYYSSTLLHAVKTCTFSYTTVRTYQQQQ